MGYFYFSQLLLLVGTIAFSRFGHATGSRGPAGGVSNCKESGLALPQLDKLLRDTDTGSVIVKENVDGGQGKEGKVVIEAPSRCLQMIEGAEATDMTNNRGRLDLNGNKTSFVRFLRSPIRGRNLSSVDRPLKNIIATHAGIISRARADREISEDNDSLFSSFRDCIRLHARVRDQLNVDTGSNQNAVQISKDNFQSHFLDGKKEISFSTDYFSDDSEKRHDQLYATRNSVGPGSCSQVIRLNKDNPGHDCNGEDCSQASVTGTPTLPMLDFVGRIAEKMPIGLISDDFSGLTIDCSKNDANQFAPYKDKQEKLEALVPKLNKSVVTLNNIFKKVERDGVVQPDQKVLLDTYIHQIDIINNLGGFLPYATESQKKAISEAIVAGQRVQSVLDASASPLPSVIKASPGSFNDHRNSAETIKRTQQCEAMAELQTCPSHMQPKVVKKKIDAIEQFKKDHDISSDADTSFDIDYDEFTEVKLLSLVELTDAFHGFSYSEPGDVNLELKHLKKRLDYLEGENLCESNARVSFDEDDYLKKFSQIAQSFEDEDEDEESSSSLADLRESVEQLEAQVAMFGQWMQMNQGQQAFGGYGPVSGSGLLGLYNDFGQQWMGFQRDMYKDIFGMQSSILGLQQENQMFQMGLQEQMLPVMNYFNSQQFPQSNTQLEPFVNW